MTTTLLSRASTRFAAGLVVTSAVLTAGCSKTEPTAAPATTGKPAASSAPTSAGSGGSSTSAAPATSAAKGDGDCPAKTEITIHTDDGDKKLEAKASKVAVTLDSTANIAIGNFEVPDDKVGSIAPPPVTGDGLYVAFYLSATKGKIEPGTYVSSSDELGPLQLNSSEAHTADGKVYFSGFASVKETVKVTVADKAKKKVCGTITTQVFEGTFVADVISWS